MTELLKHEHRDCSSCHWSLYHMPLSVRPEFGQGMEPGYYTCIFSGEVVGVDGDLGDERRCWMPQLEDETERMKQEEKTACAL